MLLALILILAFLAILYGGIAVNPLILLLLLVLVLVVVFGYNRSGW